MQHIQILATLGNNYHEKNYCEQTYDGYQLKRQHINTITRLSSNEFFFYGRDPFTIEEFNVFIKDLERMAGKLHENFHLLLSSFAVVNNGKLLNMAIYIQSGTDPKIHNFCKATQAKNDPDYSEYILYDQQDLYREMSNFVAGETSDTPIISNDSL